MVSHSVTLSFSRLVIGQAPKDAHGLHRLLWKGFGGDDQRAFLHRADVVQDEGRLRKVKVLVQSTRDADWTALGEDVIERQQVRRELRFTAGQTLRFFLRANPTVRRKRKDDPRWEGLSAEEFRARRGPRVGLYAGEELDGWLRRHAEAAGFEVKASRTSNARATRWSAKGASGVHEGVDIEGHLGVVDPALLCGALVAGLGSAKAFGFGLLSLAPADP